MPTLRSSGGVQAARLLIAAGLLTLINNLLPGYGHLNLVVMYVTGGSATLLGLIALRVPWDRLPQRASLSLVLPAFALIAVADAYGGVSPFSYAVYFVLVFVWIGIAQPPLTSFWLVPFLVAAYLAPDALLKHRVSELAGSATVAIPVCVLVGEVLARVTREHQRAQRELLLRVRVVERLATLTAEIGRDLDPVGVAQSLVDCAAEIFSCRAVFGIVAGSEVIPQAVRGFSTRLLGSAIPLDRTNIRAAAANPKRLVVMGAGATPIRMPDPGCAVTVACCSGSRIIGGLTVVLDRRPEAVTDEVLDVLRLIGTQAEVALLNAAKHSELLSEREHETAVFGVLGDGVIVLDSDGCVTSCNTAATDLFGWSAESMIGKELPIAVAEGETIENEISVGRWIETTAKRLPQSDETVLSLRDVSRQHALDEAKDLFLATTSHELRTPLTAIKGYVATLQRRWDRLSDSDRRRALDVIDEQTNALVLLTDHLLLGAEAAAAPTSNAAFDAGVVVTRTAAAYAQTSRHHQVKAAVAEGLPFAIGDADAVRSALAQIIENAVKYSPGGGEVLVVAYCEGERIVVEVRDRGIGLPPGWEETLFLPFVQGDAANTRQFGGFGLGLYIVRRLIEAQGGQATASARAGGGAIVRFWLPAAPLPAQRGIPPVHASG